MSRSQESIFKELSGHLALSASSNEHEACNAAKKACDLIREHDLVVVKREEVELARRMYDAYQNCVVLVREEYEKLLESARKPPSARRKGKPSRVQNTLADAAGDIMSSVVRGAIRKL